MIKKQLYKDADGQARLFICQNCNFLGGGEISKGKKATGMQRSDVLSVKILHRN